ncbi:uncharacterized protein LOC119161185 [Rhipicephalus microplus]|uniref:uncharacterized protein LOC119161185 n=1 Tax=Rhipicephalus microplus TaxID=6941 RepID=UPI003F6BC3A7
MSRLLPYAVLLALLGFALAAPAEEATPAAKAPAEEAKPASDGDKAVEGRTGFYPGYGVGAYGSAFNRGGSFGLGSYGNSYGNGGFGYNYGGSNRRDYGHVQTYGDRETFGIAQNAGANRRYGQGSFGNVYKNQAFGAGGNRYGVGYQGGYLG